MAVEEKYANALTPDALAGKAADLGLKINSGWKTPFDPTLTNESLVIVHVDTGQVVADEIQSRIEIFRFLMGWQAHMEFAKFGDKSPNS